MNPLLAAGARRHFALFLHITFGHLHSGDPPLELSWYLKAICHALTEASATPGSRLVITVPPRHLKSVAASVALPAYLLGLDPTRRIMVATYSQDLARLHASQCRDIMQTDWYRRIFPDAKLADDGTRALDLRTTARGGRKAVSVGGSVTGHGADVIHRRRLPQGRGWGQSDPARMVRQLRERARARQPIPGGAELGHRHDRPADKRLLGVHDLGLSRWALAPARCTPRAVPIPRPQARDRAAAETMEGR